jgi:hypothetical protein
MVFFANDAESFLLDAKFCIMPFMQMRHNLISRWKMIFAPCRQIMNNLRAVLKPAIAFEIGSTPIFLVSFTPATAWLMNWLVARSGQYAISDNDLLSFFLSMHGILFLLLSFGFALAFWFAKQTGLLIIVVNANRTVSVSVSRVLWEHLLYLSALLRLGLLQAAGYLAALIPFGHRHWTDILVAAGQMGSVLLLECSAIELVDRSIHSRRAACGVSSGGGLAYCSMVVFHTHAGI